MEAVIGSVCRAVPEMSRAYVLDVLDFMAQFRASSGSSDTAPL
jgi:hypothetical protein